MPSWSTRPSQPGSNLHPDFLSASTSSSGSHTPSNDRRPAPPYPPLVGVPSLSSEAAGLPPPTLHSPGGSSSRRSLGHSRSLSHPFPSFFGGGSRRADRRGGGGGDDLYDEAGNIVSDVDVEVLPTMHPTGPKPSGRKNTQPEDMDFLTGNCATCDSTVRWPRTLDVYRCTVCQMVNDLKPGGVAKESAAPGLQKVARKAPSLSLEKTRTVIEQCITAYLQEVASNRMKSPINPSSRDQAMNRKPSSGLESRGTRRPSHGSHRRSPTGDLDISSLGLSNDHTDLPSTTSLSKTNTNDTMEEDKRLSGKYIFRQLENYLIACMNDCDCLNNAFITSLRPPALGRTASEASVFADRSRKPDPLPVPNEDPLFEVDAKTLLLGDIGENGTWWTGNRRPSNKAREPESAQASTERKSLRLDLPTIYQWYDAILSCGRNWRNYRRQMPTESRQLLETPELDHQLEDRFVEGRYHAQRTLLKTMENLLRRPGRPLREPDECRFLIILLLNPQLFPQHGRLMTPTPELRDPLATRPRRKPSASQGSATGHHSGIIKRVLGLMSNTSSDCHQALVSWTCRLTESHFRDLAELVNGFVSYRLGRQHRGRSDSNDPTAGLVPSMTGLGAGTSAHLHAALGVHRQTSNKEPKDKIVVYGNDWQIRAAAKVMSLLFSANNHPKFPKFEYPRYVADPTSAAARQRAHRHAQLLPTSAFYNSLLDTADLITDFETWESRSSKFCFCQYPMFLSIWAKIRIMEHDARRQMEVKARDAFFTSIMSRKAVNQYLVLKVRRDCLVDDSLRSVSEVVGTGQEEIKKGLRIEFTGEEGVDAGGLRKEWFLLLVREVFDPDHGLFVYDEESNYCYFNPNSFETSDQFFLVGVVLGLAIYNSTILDVALPPFAFRKLLSSAPSYSGPVTTATRPIAGYTLDDLAEWKPSLARGLRALLEFDGDVQETFARDFVADVERYGQVVQIPLCPNGAQRPVTTANRREFVDLYIRYLLDTAVTRQYEPFKRGFFTVCGGNALPLFRPEEIELLIRGSDEPLDVAALRAVAAYEHWPSQWLQYRTTEPDDGARADEPEIATWFWRTFANTDPKSQRQLLTFITGSDRIPAMGAASVVIKVSLLTADYRRYPVARTCFNQLGLHVYRNPKELEDRLWGAVGESEGFGLK